MSFCQPDQSSSASPSSMETIGYLRHKSHQKSIISSVLLYSPDFQNKYSPGLPAFTASSYISVLAPSIAIEKSSPGRYPAFSIAPVIKESASSSWARCGANPPSSPMEVANPFSANSFFKVAYTFTHHSKHWWKEDAPIGIIINSWIVKLLSACFPPFIIFIIGIGITRAFGPPRYWYNGTPSCFAAAFATASDVPKIALAPSFALFAVPSSRIISVSISTWFNAFFPSNLSARMSLIFSTARFTPFPR